MDAHLANELDLLLLELESWDGQLLFGEGDTKIDLCSLLRTSDDTGVLAHYQFDNVKYVGVDAVNSIRKDLMLAAKHCGYDLVTSHSGTTNQAVGVLRKVTLSCSRHRCYRGDKCDSGATEQVLLKDVSCHGTVFSHKKRYNNSASNRPDVQVRKTNTFRPTEVDYLCPFKVSVKLRSDGFWYLSNPHRYSSDCYHSLQHRFHPKLSHDEVTNLSLRYASKIELEELKKHGRCHLKSSLSAIMVSTLSDFRWLPSQVKYCSAKEKQLVNDLSDAVSSADYLLSYLRSRDDVSFVVLTDSCDGLVVTRGEGRPKKDNVTVLNGGPVYDRYVASFDGAATKRSLRITDDQSMLLAVAWITDEELLLMEMFPEVWFMDVTSGTNKEGRGLFLVAGKDSNNNAFTGVRIFPPSEQLWVFDWIFRDCLPDLLGRELVRRNHLCVTDGDPQIYGPLRVLQQAKDVWRGTHALCEWHLLVVGWHESVSSSIPNDTESKNIGSCAYNWIQTWFWAIETMDELDVSISKFWNWLEATDDSHPVFVHAKHKIRDFVLKSLLPKREYWLRSSRLNQLSFDAKTTSIVEGQHSALKDGTVEAASNFSIAKAAEVMVQNSSISHSIKRCARASNVCSTPLWSFSPTAGVLTSFAEMIVCCNFDKSKEYVGYLKSHRTWVVMQKKHLRIDHNSSTNLIPSFKRCHIVHVAENNFLCCDCGFFHRMLLPCKHVIHVFGELTPLMCHIRWHKKYVFHFGKKEDVTAALKKLTMDVPVGVPMDGTKLKSLIDTVTEFPSPGHEATEDDLMLALEFFDSWNQAHNDDGGNDVVSETTRNGLLHQEMFLSPARIRSQLESDEAAVLNNSNSPRTYRDCLKIFNFVYNHFSGVPNGYKKLSSALFNAYNDSLSSLASTSTTAIRTGDSQILSFPEIHTSPRRCRKRSAGFL